MGCIAGLERWLFSLLLPGTGLSTVDGRLLGRMFPLHALFFIQIKLYTTRSSALPIVAAPAGLVQWKVSRFWPGTQLISVVQPSLQLDNSHLSYPARVGYTSEYRLELHLHHCYFRDCAIPESEDSRRSIVPAMLVVNCCFWASLIISCLESLRNLFAVDSRAVLLKFFSDGFCELYEKLQPPSICLQPNAG